MNCRESDNAMDRRMIGLPESDGQRQQLQSHLATCSDCTGRYSGLREVDTLIAASVTLEDPNPFLWTRIAARLEEPSRAVSPGWIAAITRLPLMSAFWLRQRQMAAGICMLVLLVSALFINSQSIYFERVRLLGLIDESIVQLVGTPSNENPFPMGLAGTTGGSDNPFPALPQINVDSNPFEKNIGS